ncbi:MAG: aldehyde ferredoxin oxidoreductase family protein, partial [Rhodospirillales bacterium]|nr:aldehyde ferredoxin oxidoreductase family protein [Rhodospirillales bacterium]
TCKSEPLNMDWARAYIGQRGLGSRYLAAEVDPKIDALDPANKLIFATGPLTGTSAPTGGRSSAITKSPLTGAIAASNTGGMFGAEIKTAGWDMVIIEGRAASPVLLWIKDDQASLLPADKYWGQSVWAVEPAIKTQLAEPDAKVASIGRAGERGVRFACIVNDMDRAYGRSGVGAVMGSKNLKAIAVRGTRGVKVADPNAFIEAVAAAQAKVAPSPVKDRFEKYGTHPMMDVTNNYGALPTRNSREVQFEGTGKVNAASVRKIRPTDGKASLVTNKGCFACTIACGRIARIDRTHFSLNDKGKDSHYRKPSGGLEYESAFAFAPLLGIDDLEAATFANFVCNDEGMDPISLGGSIAAAMELFEEGAITSKDTGGIEIRFGNAEALVKLAELTGKAEGFGVDIGLGAQRLCEKYGRPEFSMTVKGQEFPGYDPRAMQGMGLAYATSNRGACHIRARPYAADFQSTSSEGKAAVVKDTQDLVAAIDSSGVCVFSANILAAGDYAAMVSAATGEDWSEQRYLEAGERTWNIERQFNLAAGLTRADDTLPKRNLETPAPSGAAKGMVNELDRMLPEYYTLRGWDDDGVPTGQILKRLGME